MREGSGYKNLEREGPSREAGGGQMPTSSSARGCGPARNPGVLAPSMLLDLLGIRKSARNIKQLCLHSRKKGEPTGKQIFSRLCLEPILPDPSSLQGASQWKMAPQTGLMAYSWGHKPLSGNKPGSPQTSSQRG